MSNEIFASSCPTFPNVSFFDGHIRNHMGIFGVHYGDPDFLLNIPRPQDALPPPNGYHKLKQGDLDHPLWLNHQFAYLCLLPRSNPFRGPIFECLDVKMWKLPIERCLPSFHSEEERFGLAQATIDRWWRLESLLRMMLDKMTGFYTGEMPKGLTHFTYPLLYGYKQRNAYTEQQARKSAIRSRDAFLPLMARITLMYILLDATDSGDWRAALQRSTRLPWQWFDDMEASAVGNLNIDRMGGIFDLTLVRSDPYQYLPRHARWLFSFLISKQRVPLYFFYGQQFPLTDQQPIPPALSDRGFVPDAAEVSYLRSLPGDVAFSRWSSRALPWTSLRNVSSGSSNSLGLISAPISSPSLNRPAASDFGTARYFPPVDPDSGQLPGEDIHAFLERRKLRNEQQLENDTEMRKKRRAIREGIAAKKEAPPVRDPMGARIFIWEDERGFSMRRLTSRRLAADRWDEFTLNQRIYDSFSNEWDLCQDLAPDEEAHPQSDNFDDDDDDDDLWPYNDDDAMKDVSGDRAEEVLAEGYIENRPEDGDELPGYREVRVADIMEERFGLRASPVNLNLADPQLQPVTCQWAVGDAKCTLPVRSALPHLLHHISKCRLAALPQGLSDLTWEDSDLSHDWELSVKLLSSSQRSVYIIRPSGCKESSPSIILESAASVLQVVRSGWAAIGDVDSLIRNLVGLGIEFYPCWLRQSSIMPDVLPSQPGLGRRPEKYKPTTVDYTAYVQRRNTFLNSSRGRLALFSGGLVARLARLVISDFEDKARIDPSNEELDGGLRVVNKQGDVAVWHEALTPSEIDLICGVYPTETGQPSNGDAQLKYISWFPLPAAFCSSSLHTGWWNVSCERWLQKRLDDISQGKAALYTNHEWRKNIRFHAAAHKIRLALEDISAEYLATRSHVVRL